MRIVLAFVYAVTICLDHADAQVAAPQIQMSPWDNIYKWSIVNDKYLIQGGQPVEAFEQALRKIAAES